MGVVGLLVGSVVYAIFQIIGCVLSVGTVKGGRR